MVFAYVWTIFSVPDDQLINFCVCFVDEFCWQMCLVVVSAWFVVEED